ncbi:phage tail protein [Serratia inhibens]|uniref:Phage tail protein n=1 Tax=Serratia inhibens TaxID=2338073 RepID=A0AA92X8X8_9GAMM|nr:phage tail protein [Serratia inhibens]ANS43230.1 hypothetical protein Q5A_013885 [Serratia inhibens PRI-2C]RJF57342.1 phage tail protein [Serratia inhibens]
MADSSDIIDATNPVPSFRFTVTIGDDVIRCSSVSGLDQQYDSVDYRDGMGGLFRAQLPSITLSQAVFPGECKFYEWLYNYANHSDGKKDISISLTDESGKVLYVTWNVFNCFPTGITGPSLDASSNEVVVKQITLNADRLTVECHSV